MDFDVEAAREEVNSKSEAEIEIETAYKWASRSIASYQEYAATKELKWLLRGEDYLHECIEHAALAKDGGKTLSIIEEEVEKYRPKKETKDESVRPQSVARPRPPFQPKQIQESKPSRLADQFDDCGIPKDMF